VEESRIEVAEEEQPEETDELINLLKEWIKELPDRRREAFVLSRFEGLDHEEIADVMDISSNTVNNHIVAALDYLKDCSSKYQEEMNNKRQGYD
jgi:RNA polymerase sigma-70 factor (ECF subfamily)